MATDCVCELLPRLRNNEVLRIASASSVARRVPAITRDPVTGVLVVGANDEIGQPLCSGTTTPLASPCPFAPGVPTSSFCRSTDNGATWSGGYLPGFDSIGRTSGGADPFVASRP